MDDLTAFLNARLDDDEAVANEVHRPRDCGSVDRDGSFDPRVLREIEAKRAIVRRYKRESGSRLPGRRVALDVLTGPLRDLAAVYSDHPDYRPEWKP